jgi:hypothetical protein
MERMRHLIHRMAMAEIFLQLDYESETRLKRTAPV